MFSRSDLCVVHLGNKVLAFGHKVVGQRPEEFLGHSELFNEGIAVPLLQQSDGSLDLFGITLNDVKITLIGKYDVGIKHRILSKQTPYHHEFHAVNRRAQFHENVQIRIFPGEEHTVAEGGKVSQGLNVAHGIIVLGCTELFDAGSPKAHLFKYP